MPSSYTSNLRFTLQATGENLNLWGALNNAGVVSLIDTAIAGRYGVALSAPLTLTSANGSTDQSRNAILDFTSGSGGTVTIPAVSKTYYVRNATSGNVVISTGGTTNATLATGDVMPVFSDGTSVYGLKLSGLDLSTYIASMVLAATGSLPAVTGNAGKYVYTDGVISYWKQVQTTDLGDIASYTAARTAFSIVAALVF